MTSEFEPAAVSQETTTTPEPPHSTALSPLIASILSELAGALDELLKTGKTYTIFLHNTGLNEEQQVQLLQALGESTLTVELAGTDEPARWYETNYSGIWVGTFRNHRGEAMLRTIEVARYPELAGALNEDIASGRAELLNSITADFEA